MRQKPIDKDKAEMIRAIYDLICDVVSNRQAELYVTPLQDEIGLLQSELLRKHIFSKDISLDSEINRAKYLQRNREADKII